MHKLEFIQYTKNNLRVENRGIYNTCRWMQKLHVSNEVEKIKKKYDRYGQSIYFLCRVDILAIFWYNFRLRTKRRKIREGLFMLCFKHPVQFLVFEEWIHLCILQRKISIDVRDKIVKPVLFLEYYHALK